MIYFQVNLLPSQEIVAVMTDIPSALEIAEVKLLHGHDVSITLVNMTTDEFLDLTDSFI